MSDEHDQGRTQSLPLMGEADDSPPPQPVRRAAGMARDSNVRVAVLYANGVVVRFGVTYQVAVSIVTEFDTLKRGRLKTAKTEIDPITVRGLAANEALLTVDTAAMLGVWVEEAFDSVTVTVEKKHG